MHLTAEQRALWNEVGGIPRPSGDQTVQQAVNLAVDSFRYVCHLEGIEPPSEEAIRAEMPCGGQGKPKP